ncbi:MAG: zinc ribbon domain-containing protein [Patescibacteria group bacterium]
MKQCIACGMPLEKPEDFAKNDENSEFCLYCVNEDGSVKTCDAIFAGGVEFFLKSLGDDRALAEKLVRKNMNQLSYWQGKDCEVLKGEMASDQEFNDAMQRL